MHGRSCSSTLLESWNTTSGTSEGVAVSLQFTCPFSEACVWEEKEGREGAREGGREGREGGKGGREGREGREGAREGGRDGRDGREGGRV